jgi:hypothetical protein
MSFTLLLILFNLFISALYDSLNPKSLSLTQDLTSSKIFTLNLTKNQKESLKLYNGNEYKHVYLSIFVLNGTNIKVNSNNNKILNETDLNNNNKSIFIAYNTSEYSTEINIDLTSTSDEDAQVEVTNNLQKDLPIYQTLSLNENEVKKNNFVFFMEKKNNKYEIKINFNEKEKEKEKPEICYYQVVRLPKKDSNYILPASYYNNEEKKCDFNKLSFNYDNVTDKTSTKDEIAFIFSIKDNKEFNYKVTVTKIDEAMNIFLYVSIGLAGVFAVITFFLIRRKQSIDTKNDDNQEDLYNNDENKDEQ